MNIALEYEDIIQSMMSLGVRCAASADRTSELYRMIRHRKINRRVAAREVKAIERHLDDLLQHIADLTNRFRTPQADIRPALELVKSTMSGPEEHEPHHQE